MNLFQQTVNRTVHYARFTTIFQNNTGKLVHPLTPTCSGFYRLEAPLLSPNNVNAVKERKGTDVNCGKRPNPWLLHLPAEFWGKGTDPLTPALQCQYHIIRDNSEYWADEFYSYRYTGFTLLNTAQTTGDSSVNTGTTYGFDEQAHLPIVARSQSCWLFPIGTGLLGAPCPSCY